jgi:hypothetical protein
MFLSQPRAKKCANFPAHTERISNLMEFSIEIPSG